MGLADLVHKFGEAGLVAGGVGRVQSKRERRERPVLLGKLPAAEPDPRSI
jgi:hypothetical protein